MSSVSDSPSVSDRPPVSAGRSEPPVSGRPLGPGGAEPPFRADHVGSLLRPPALLAARAEFAAGRLDGAGLRAAEDIAVVDAVAMQEEIGLRSATDGEFRRTSWQMDFIHRLGGGRTTEEQISVRMRNASGEGAFTSAGLAIDGKVELVEPILADDFRFLAPRVTTAVPKLTIPSPSMVHYRGGSASISPSVCPDVDHFCADLCAAYADELRALGCRYLQLDDTSLAYLNDPAQRAELAARSSGDADAEHLRYIRQINAALADRPAGMRVTTHMCRGNFRSSWAAEGGYEFVAEALFGELDVDGFLCEFGRRALRRVRAAAVRAAGQAGGARAGHDQDGRPGGPRHPQAPHRRGRQVRPARPAVSLPAVRLLLDGGGQRHHGRGAGGEAAADRRGRRGRVELKCGVGLWC